MADIAAYLSTSAGYTTKFLTIDGYHSPRGVVNAHFCDSRMNTLCERALAVAQSALVYSDINFLFPPGQIAFAAVSISLEGKGYEGQLGNLMRNYLRMRFPQKTPEELRNFEYEVMSIISNLEACPAIDLSKFSGVSRRRGHRKPHHQAAEVQRVFAVAAHFRGQSHSEIHSHQTRMHIGRSRKRVRSDEHGKYSQRPYKAVRVTPNQTPYF